MITAALNSIGFIISLHLVVTYDAYLRRSQPNMRRTARMQFEDAYRIRFQVLLILGLLAGVILALVIWMIF